MNAKRTRKPTTIDLDAPAPACAYSPQQQREAIADAHQYSVSLSADSIRGRMDSLKAGNWPNGGVCYGYDREYTDPRTGEKHRLPRTGPVVKAQGWTLRLVRNKEEAAIVRYIFEEFLNKDTSLADIARTLSVPTPSGKGSWTRQTVRYILDNRTYMGYSYIGANKRNYDDKDFFNRAEHQEVPGAVEAIISEEDWQRAQDKLAENADKKTLCHAAKAGALKGLLYCGHCGYSLAKVSRVLKKTGERVVAYRCQSPNKHRPPSDKSSKYCICRRWGVREDEWLPRVVQALLEQLDAAELERSNPKPPDAKPTGLDAINEQLETLATDLKHGDVNLARATTQEEYDRIIAVIRQWEEQRTELERKKANLTVKGDLTQFNEWYHQIKGDLVTIARDQFQYVHADGSVETLWESYDPLPRRLRNEMYRRAGVYGPDNPDGIYTPERHPHPSWEADTGGLVLKESGSLLEGSRFRALLKKLGCRVTFKWKPKPVKGGESSKDYVVAEALLKINGAEYAWTDGNWRPRASSGPSRPSGARPRRPG
jgi:hypothetical protein